jgi:hypothetical protein
MAAIPTHVKNMIEDYVCRKVHNTVSSSHGLLICLDIDFEKKIEGNLENSIKERVYNCLDRAHQALDFKYSWDFIFNVRDDQYQHDYYDDVCQLNRIQIAVHFHGDCDALDWPLFKEDTRPAVDPAKGTRCIQCTCCPTPFNTVA